MACSRELVSRYASLYLIMMKMSSDTYFSGRWRLFVLLLAIVIASCQGRRLTQVPRQSSVLEYMLLHSGSAGEGLGSDVFENWLRNVPGPASEPAIGLSPPPRSFFQPLGPSEGALTSGQPPPSTPPVPQMPTAQSERFPNALAGLSERSISPVEAPGGASSPPPPAAPEAPAVAISLEEVLARLKQRPPGPPVPETPPEPLAATASFDDLRAVDPGEGLGGSPQFSASTAPAVLQTPGPPLAWATDDGCGDGWKCLDASVSEDKGEYDGILQEVEDGRWEALIPASGDTSHASFIVETPYGYITAWFSGETEGYSGVGIYVSTRGWEDTSAWSLPQLVIQEDGYSMQNPVLLYDDSTGLLHLFHTRQEALEDKDGNPMDFQVTATIWHHVADLAGGVVKFEYMDELPLGPGVFDRNRIIPDPVQPGWLYPIYYHKTTDKMEDYSHLVRLAPGNLKFLEEIEPSSWKDGFVQASIISLDGEQTLKAFFRDRGKKSIYSSTSTNGGRSWGSLKKNTLINNNAGIHTVKLDSGALLMVYNPLRRRRYHLSVAVSFDEGESWPIVRDLECNSCDGSDGDSERESTHASGDDHGPEFSYPSAFQGSDGRIHITYTWSKQSADMSDPASPGLRDTIKYVVLTTDFLGIDDSAQVVSSARK